MSKPKRDLSAVQCNIRIDGILLKQLRHLYAYDSRVLYTDRKVSFNQWLNNALYGYVDGQGEKMEKIRELFRSHGIEV